MSARTVPEALRGIIRFRQQRMFQNHYQCDQCPNEWTDEMLTQGASFCPCCDREVEPYCVEAFTEERAEFDLEETG